MNSFVMTDKQTRWLNSRLHLSALALSALPDWHYLLGCASAQVQSSYLITKEIHIVSFYLGNPFIFICDEFICDEFHFTKEIPLFSFS